MRIRKVFYCGLPAIALTLGPGLPYARAVVSVVVQPSSQAVLVGSNAVFTAQATVTAGETITGYSWLMSTNDQNPFITIVGATNAVCTLTNVRTSDAGYYFVKATYNSGTNLGAVAVSASVTLTVHDQARIISQPQGGLIRAVGTSASFSVAALGSSPLTYQWRFNGINLVNGGRISGAGGTNLTVDALVTADSGNYDVVVTNL